MTEERGALTAAAARARAVPRVLSIAGSDSGGGAGIQADVKTIAAWGGYGMTVVTAVTAQNTQGVQAVHPLPLEAVQDQLDAVGADIAVDAVKVGMLGSPAVMEVVSAWLEGCAAPVVLDPVMVASSGDSLTAADAAAWERLLGAADLVTPNLPELEVLTERTLPDWEGALAAAGELAARHAVTVLVKGGHLDPDEYPDGVPDALVAAEEEAVVVTGSWQRVRSTHGTGCTLASALATLAGAGLGWEEALRQAKPWLAEAMRRGEALAVGQAELPGWHGPVDHGWREREQSAPSRTW
ncbi:bifunctional hydroxymethylpyrimidine kinase/phosphomethylpyrimidine kinase [Micrococcus sp. FDAARGOS_333]|uniref:bifunctional hydroxymethylpyrimidine kinase/phosphomethylpyrimidine kinase n=1 Tax=Micrococcus sp. FDAARGOS_333 TaxID=1930558 RepID=UPI000B4DF4CE|nr:bifunctional hydroxymethylpyrimidine kinase/phosphomethylpyrimidine kinase [Micrococcus sp. FDAARGOS_333]PNL17738.1 bifunctional hydroxymethylpyrimidine kinase/phosphomethylpyrimidine kinase [Micrococcus sp. FDAARGOS_333]